MFQCRVCDAVVSQSFPRKELFITSHTSFGETKSLLIERSRVIIFIDFSTFGKSTPRLLVNCVSIEEAKISESQVHVGCFQWKVYHFVTRKFTTDIVNGFVFEFQRAGEFILLLLAEIG